MNLLFDIEERSLPDITGLDYIPHFVCEREEKTLLDQIDNQPWLGDLKRRVQHYGYKYDYKARAIDKSAYLGSLPDWLTGLCQALVQEGFFEQCPDQVIVNEYLPGQGISAHIDCVPCFGNIIASLTLGSAAIMQFIKPETAEKQNVLLEEGSLIILSGEARYKWQHAIPARKSDVVDGFKTERRRRASLTFRNVVIDRE